VEEAEGRFREAGYRVSGIVARGDPSQEILRYATQRDVDLIALGARGLTGVRGFLLGSVATPCSQVCHGVCAHSETTEEVKEPPGSASPGSLASASAIVRATSVVGSRSAIVFLSAGVPNLL
jgi:hypothetical protein